MKQQRNPSFKSIKLIFPYLKAHALVGVALFILMLLGMLVSLPPPLILKEIIDKVLVRGNLFMLNTLILVLLLLAVANRIFSVAQNYLFSLFGQRVIFDIRNDLFQHLLQLDLKFFFLRKTGELISIANNDVETLQGLVTRASFSLIRDIFTIFIILGILIYMHWKLALVSLSVLPLFFLSALRLNQRIRKYSKLGREKVADLLSFLQEVFTNISLVKVFSKENYETHRHQNKGEELMNLRIRLGLSTSIAGALAGFVATLGPVLVLWYGGYQVIHASITIGALMAFYTYIIRLYNPILSLVQFNVTLQTASASADRIFSLFQIHPKIRNRRNAIILKDCKGHIEFDDVTFSYDSTVPVLRNVTFKVSPGQIIALTGPSGIGKTTVVNLLCRFYDPTSGSIKIDGRDIRNYELKSLREQLSIVTQETMLFNETIKQNLKYGNPEAKDPEIIEAAKMAGIHEFIETLPQKYNTLVGERGIRLSGGQRQRIGLARSILKDPKILILDEATSSLDFETEESIKQALRDMKDEKTIIIISHRLWTIRGADIIIRLEDGGAARVIKGYNIETNLINRITAICQTSHKRL